MVSKTRPVKRHVRERGASLILAMIFMSVVSLISLALATWATTGLRSTISFTAAQSTVSTANSVAELAVQEVRYHFFSSSLWAQPPASCWDTSGTPSVLNQYGLNNQPMNAWCSTRWSPSSVTTTRRVTIYVCPITFSNSACATTPFLQVIVSFDDYPAAGGSLGCNYDNPNEWTTCGTYMTINSWVYATNPPTITQFVPGTAAGCSGTNSFTIDGTGYVSGSTTVYFVSRITSTNNGVTSTTLQVLKVSGSGITTNSIGTVLSGCLPTGLSGTANIIVSTPVGQSAQAVQQSF